MSKAKVAIVVGTGGIGKTTIASALALKEAMNGKKVLLITIDPAKRLMDALGIKTHGAVPISVDLSTTRPHQGPSLSGELHAYMPDLRLEWRGFLKASLPIKERQIIEKNPFFSYLIEGLPGSLEVICSHILFRFMKAGKFDLIVLDTPPSAQALTFFDVPQKLNQVLLHPLFKKLTGQKSRFFLKLTKRFALFGTSVWEKTVENIIGTHFLSMIIQFGFALESLYEPLVQRASAMTKLLTSKDCSVFLVTKLQKRSIDEALVLKSELSDKRGIDLRRVIINQILPDDLNELILEKQKIKISEDNQLFLESLLKDKKARINQEKVLEKAFSMRLSGIPVSRIEQAPASLSRIQLLSFIAQQIPEVL